jgi:hypothetical protein
MDSSPAQNDLDDLADLVYSPLPLLSPPHYDSALPFELPLAHEMRCSSSLEYKLAFAYFFVLAFLNISCSFCTPFGQECTAAEGDFFFSFLTLHRPPLAVPYFSFVFVDVNSPTFTM